jgi:hypothetical protein
MNTFFAILKRISRRNFNIIDASGFVAWASLWDRQFYISSFAAFFVALLFSIIIEAVAENGY